MQTPAFLKGHTIEVEEVAPGMSRQMLGFNDEIMMVKVFFEEGAEGYLHAHRHSQVTYIESGEFEVTVGVAAETLGPGDCFFMEPHAPHGAVCKKAGVLIDVFSPMREDFLKEGVS